ncbi:MAG: hypothetical protein K2J16_07195 [Clostridia bacterium]|nr:hypothetical protein [Clostridia bacterium]
MKKFARVIIISAVILVLCLTLCACGNKYKSHYKAFLMTESNTSNSASVSFDTFSGVYVAKLNNSGNDKVVISYNAKLEEGNIKVYYDFDDEKLSLFEIRTDGNVEGKTEAFTGNKIIYVIIEADDECSAGSFSFALEKAPQ